MFRISVTTLALAALCACDDGADFTEESDAPGPAPSGAILTLGDSIFDFHEEPGLDVPEVIGEALGRTVVDRSQGGAHFALPEFAAEDPAFDIRRQYQAGDWSWVVLDGGGNDVNDQCGCGDCAEVLDRLVSDDGLDGEIPDFARRVIADGARLMFVGYYTLPEGAAFGFDRCDDEMQVQTARLERMAAAIDGAYFVSAAEVVTGDDVSLFDGDRVHPSVEGSRVVGLHVADAIRAIEGR